MAPGGLVGGGGGSGRGGGSTYICMRNVRGRTRGLASDSLIRKYDGSKIPVQWDLLDRKPSGPNASHLSNEIGFITRNFAPLHVETWYSIEASDKTSLIDRILPRRNDTNWIMLPRREIGTSSAIVLVLKSSRPNLLRAQTVEGKFCMFIAVGQNLLSNISTKIGKDKNIYLGQRGRLKYFMTHIGQRIRGGLTSKPSLTIMRWWNCNRPQMNLAN